MLSYILAIAVGLGSLSLYLATFVKPHLHRKDDFILSGLGLFYALVLWTCAGRITGGVLLGQVAGVALLSWFVWETLSLRGIFTKPDPETVISEVAKSKIEEVSLSKLFNQIVNKFNQKPVINNIPTPSISVENNVEKSQNIAPNLETASISFDEIETKVEPAEEIVEIEAETTPEMTIDNEEILEESPAEIAEIKQEIIPPLETETEESIEIKPIPSVVNMEEKKGFSFSKLITNISGIFNKPKAEKQDNIVVTNDHENDDFDLDETENKSNINEMGKEIEENSSQEMIKDQVGETEVIESEVIEIQPEINQITSELMELQEANISEEIIIEATAIDVKEEVILVESNETNAVEEINQDQIILSEEKEETKAEITIEDQEIKDSIKVNDEPTEIKE